MGGAWGTAQSSVHTAQLGGAGRPGATCVCLGTSSSPRARTARAAGVWGTSRLALWLRPAGRGFVTELTEALQAVRLLLPWGQLLPGSP